MLLRLLAVWAICLATGCTSWTPTPTSKNGAWTSTQLFLSTTEQTVSLDSPILGGIYRLGGNDDDGSFLSTMGVPTFASVNKASEGFNSKTKCTARGLEGVLNQGPAFVLDDVLSKDTCEQLIADCESLGFGSFSSGKNHHGALQIVVSDAVAKSVGDILSRHIDVDQVAKRRRKMMQATESDYEEGRHDVRLIYSGLNRRWRVYRYDPHGNETFAPHIDAGFPPSGLSPDGNNLLWDVTKDDDDELVSRLTVLFYLNDDFEGGETNFYKPNDISSLIASVRPITGSCLVFPQAVGGAAVEYARSHWPLHEGSPVRFGRPKYVIRSDVIFATQSEVLPIEDPFAKYDHLVRDTFLPRSPTMNRHFLSQISSLYNPHMGVENLGVFLYSFLRFTKKRRVVEIGAGYTSLWILQALKDNDDEFARISDLEKSGKCRLLDIPWVDDDYDDKSPSSLLCIDNCAHQKETATGASAVAKGLGLDGYLDFLQADAFDIKSELGEESIDVLWCDFGVGARMKEFVSAAWSSLKPGGFLLCHSTLTNTNTRAWLEAARRRDDESVTGIPPDEYVELSLLEPHKRFQNSISIFQKRKSYEEAVYSKYA